MLSTQMNNPDHPSLEPGEPIPISASSRLAPWSGLNRSTDSADPKSDLNPQVSLDEPASLATSANLEHQLLQAILESDQPSSLLRRIAHLLGATFSVDACFIVVRSQVQGCPQMAVWSADPLDSHFQTAEDVQNFLNHPTLTQQWLSLEPLVVTDTEATFQSAVLPTKTRTRHKHPIEKRFPKLPFNCRSILARCTEFQDDVNGMVIFMRSQPYQWQESDLQQLQHLSPQIAIAISHAHLNQQVYQRIQYQNLIDQLTTAIRSGWELHQIFQTAVEGTGSALSVNRGMVILFKYAEPIYKSRAPLRVPKVRASVVAEWVPPTDMRSAVPGTDSIQESWLNHAFWVSDCSLCQALLKGKADPLILPGSSWPEAEPFDWQSVSAVFNVTQATAALILPLENQGTVLGCLVLQSYQSRLWIPEELSFAKLAAAQLSTAIIQTRTIQQIQAVVQERTAQLQRSLDVQAKLYEKTRQQVEQLRRLNQEREEFLSTVSHELRTPLTSMTLAIRMLRQANLPAATQAKYLDILEQQCMQETNLINDLLALRKLESNPTPAQLQKLDIRFLVRDIVQSMKSAWTEKELQLELHLPDAPLSLYTDAESLHRIVVELLTNAHKYSDVGGTIELQVQYEEKAAAKGQILLMVQNTGAGIAPEELPHIFDKFRRGQGVTQQAVQGTGLGLALVKRLVEHLGGTIAVSSQPLESLTAWETCFTVVLPQHPEGLLQPIA